MVRRLALALLGLCLAPSALAQEVPPVPAKPIRFEVVSIRPSTRLGWSSGFTLDGYHASGASLQWMMTSDAYGVQPNRLSGSPDWLNTAKFEVEAKVAESDVEPYQHLTYEQHRQMLQAVLADRFHLVVHNEARMMPAYALTIVKGGPKMQETKAEDIHRNGFGDIMTRFLVSRGGVLTISACTMQDLARNLAGHAEIGRFVVDRTGLPGRYDITLHWTPDNTPPDSPLAGGPSIFTALEEQLGLKLEPTTAPIDFLVIDHAELPTPN